MWVLWAARGQIKGNKSGSLSYLAVDLTQDVTSYEVKEDVTHVGHLNIR